MQINVNLPCMHEIPESLSSSPLSACKAPEANAPMSTLKYQSTIVASTPRVSTSSSQSHEPAPEPFPECAPVSTNQPRSYRRLSKPPVGWKLVAQPVPQMFDDCKPARTPHHRQNVSLLKSRSTSTQRKRWAALPRF